LDYRKLSGFDNTNISNLTRESLLPQRLNNTNATQFEQI